ncbi:hypothetical protein KKG37_03370 [Patescibacteria group bacterium]|nr:hypothetical protein [Patescibacteria group bacterium]
MNTKEIQNKKEKLKLNKRQRDIVVGLLLGDGHLETQNNGKTYRLKVEHSLEQSDYVDWLYKEFSDWIPKEKPYIKNRENGLQSIGFTTYSHSSLRFYGQQFYSEDKKKHIPKLIKKLLSQIGIAVWYMDDGSLKSKRHKTYNIHTLGYSRKDLEILQKALQDKFKLETSLHKQKEKYLRIYIPEKSALKFTKIIKPYVENISSMKHKLVTQMPKK